MKLSTEKMEERMGPYVKPQNVREEYHDPDECEYEDVYVCDEEDDVRTRFASFLHRHDVPPSLLARSNTSLEVAPTFSVPLALIVLPTRFPPNILLRTRPFLPRPEISPSPHPRGPENGQRSVWSGP
jgi:hypothetical protein